MLNSLLLRLAGLSIVHTLAAGLIVVGIYYFSLYDDGASLDVNLKKIETELKAEQDKEKEVQQAYLEQEKIKKEVEQLGQQFVLASKAIPTEHQVGDILLSISTLASAAGVNVMQQQQGKETLKEIVEEKPMKVKLEGTFTEIVRFLDYLSRLERILRVRDFTISRSSAPDAKKTNRLIFEGDIISYRFVGDSKP
jgi:type IV pilus assembly protein PilO